MEINWKPSGMLMPSRRIFPAGMIIALLCGGFAFGGQSTSAQAPPPQPQSQQPAPVHAPAGSLSGHVYRADTGAPLAGGILTLHLNRRPLLGAGPPAPSPTARSGPDGAYAFASVEPGNYSVQIGQRGGFVLPEPPVELVLVTPGAATQNIDFRLQPAGAISGSVYDEYDDPLQGVTAAVFCPDPNLNPATVAYPGYGDTDALTDDQGNFRVSGLRPGHCYAAVSPDPLPLPRGPWKRATFYPNADSMEKGQPLEVKPGEEIANLRFHIPLALTGSVGGLRAGQQIVLPPAPGPAAGAVSGHIYRADTGAPIAAAIIHLFHHFDRAQMEGNAPVFSPQSARTGPDGAYTFASVEPGAYTVRVERQGFAPMTGQQPTDTQPDPSQISLETGQHLGNLDYKLQPAGAISGSVHDQDGVPLQGMFVTAFCSTTESTNQGLIEAGRATTDDRGEFRFFGLPPGGCSVGVGPPNGPLKQAGYSGVFYPHAATLEKAQLIPVRPSEEAGNIDLIDRYLPTYTITVKVVGDSNGGGESRYLVWVMSAEPGAMPTVNTLGFGASPPVMTRPDGTAVVRGVSPGTYTIRVNPARELIGAPGPTIRRPDGTVDTLRSSEHHAWVQGTGAGGSAVVQVVDRDVSVEIPLSSFPAGGGPR